MNVFDWIIIAILGIFSVKSIFRGATREIFSFLALLLAGLIACRYYVLIAPFLSAYLTIAWAQKVVAVPSANAATRPPVSATAEEAPSRPAHTRVARATSTSVPAATSALIRFSRYAGVPQGSSRTNRCPSIV